MECLCLCYFKWIAHKQALLVFIVQYGVREGGRERKREEKSICTVGGEEWLSGIVCICHFLFLSLLSLFSPPLPPSLSQDDTPLGSIDLKDVHQIAMAMGKKGFSFDLTVS